VQHLNLMVNSDSIETNVGTKTPEHNSNKLLKAGDIYWLDSEKSSICYDEIIDNGESSMEIDKISTLSVLDNGEIFVGGTLSKIAFVKNISNNYLSSTLDISNYGMPLSSKFVAGKLVIITNTHYIKIGTSGIIEEISAHENINGKILSACLTEQGIVILTASYVYFRFYNQSYFKLVYNVPKIITDVNIVSSSDGISVFANSSMIIATVNGKDFVYADIIGGSDSDWNSFGSVQDVCVFDNKIVIVKSNHAWHDNGSILIGGSASIQMTKLTVPQQGIVKSIPEIAGNISSCSVFRSEENAITRLLVGGDLGIASIKMVPISFSQMDNEQISDSVKTILSDLPCHIVRSVNGKVISSFIDSIYIDVLSATYSIRNGVVL